MKIRLQGLMKMSLMLVALISFSAQAQNRTVTGKVTSVTTGESLPGVSVLIKGTANGTVTNLEGEYTLSVNSDSDVLVYSFIGMKPIEMSVGGRSTIDIKMEDDVTSLEEIVVVGYGEQKKSVLTAAISSVKAEDLANFSAGSVDQALQGRMSGVQITPSSGSPGSGFNIKIRGAGSNGSTQPLYIVDGMRMEFIDYLDPFEIQSVEVLKDAASAAIYGAEGANGVVLVTTKEGKDGAGQISYDFQYGVQNFNSKLEVMNLQQFEEYNAEAGINRDPNEQLPSTGTDWVDEIFQSAAMQRHSITFSGGTDKTTYLIGGNYFTQEGIVGGEQAKFDRLSLRFNMKHQVNDWLEVGNKFSFAQFNRSSIQENTEFGSIVQSGILMDPATPVVYNNGLPSWVLNNTDYGVQNYPVDDNGKYYGVSTLMQGEMANPVARMNQSHGGLNQNLFSGSGYAKISPLKGLNITSRIGLFIGNGKDRSWTNSYFLNPRAIGTNGVSQTMFERINYQWENFASYDINVGDHKVNIMGGTSIYSKEDSYVSGYGAPLLNEIEELAYLDAVPDPQSNTIANGNSQLETLNSYFGRIQYNFKDKYLLGVTMRADGSSLLAEGKQWGYFPSISGGWVLSNEDFFSAGPLNFMKIRASWGINGSLSNVNPGESLAKVSAGFIYTDDLGNFQIGAEPTTVANPDLTWETTTQTDIGIDFGFFDDKFTGTFDYFIKTTEDLLVPGTPPSFVGNPAGLVNNGTVENKGIELELGYQDESGPLKYAIDLNFTKINNKVTEVDPNKIYERGANIGIDWNSATAMQEGKPIWFFRGYETAGIFQDQTEVNAYTSGVSGYTPEPGDPIIVDQLTVDTDDDGVPDATDGMISEADFVEIGSPHPDFMLGARVKLEYKGFDFQVFAQGSFGNDVIMGFNRSDRIESNKPSFFYEDRWTESGSTNSWFRAGTATQAYTSDLMVFDGSFLKIRQVQLGYNLPKSLIGNIGVSKVRVYVSLDNFFTFTDYKGFDPEVGGSNTPSSLGIDRGSYPVPKTFLTGLTVQF
ncbi:MAG: TonB-dependent receptor [Reichenbachiella sp.]|uniref:SusC/RagA family TonB-linked outer membrane protein n=1 Tax=Reichenbachiella sp. TaxID=2184521 RepID=UPI0032999ABF